MMKFIFQDILYHRKEWCFKNDENDDLNYRTNLIDIDDNYLRLY